MCVTMWVRFCAERGTSAGFGKLRWASGVIERRHSMPGIEPGPPRLSPRTVRPPYWWRITDQLRPMRNGQGDGICTRTVRVTGGDANCYIATLKNGAPGRTRTDEYGFTKPALWLLRHRGFKNGALTWICTTNLRLRRAACRDYLHLESQKRFMIYEFG